MRRSQRLTRREWIPAAGAAIAASCGGSAPQVVEAGERRSAVAIVKAATYEGNLQAAIRNALDLLKVDVRQKTVMIKPNLVEFDKRTAINTDPRLVHAAFECFQQMGARHVWIGEGPGHRRDTFGVAEEAGYLDLFDGFEQRFVDLNRDDVAAVEGFGTEGRFYFSQTLLSADLIVSMPKMKTHHWAGATLSMKNLFGVVPGALYGWPKNKLHHIGIAESISLLARTFRNTLAIVDGIVGMEGNGPIQGTPKHCGVIVAGRNLRAVDATCCRIMGIDPLRLDYIRMTEGLGPASEAGIDQRGEAIAPVSTEFQLIPEFHPIRIQKG